jgi:hypothetical protein
VIIWNTFVVNASTAECIMTNMTGSISVAVTKEAKEPMMSFRKPAKSLRKERIRYGKA